jgi:hypothetical protein
MLFRRNVTVTTKRNIASDEDSLLEGRGMVKDKV